MNPKILIAGIGNIFLGDDAFGAEVARRLVRQEWPCGVEVIDFGIRGFDLAYALMDDFDLFILVDAMPHGAAPGTIQTIEVDTGAIGDSSEPLESHALHPLRVLEMVKSMGGNPRRVIVVGCEPEPLSEQDELEGRMGLSFPVAEAVERAIGIVGTLVAAFRRERDLAEIFV